MLFALGAACGGGDELDDAMNEALDATEAAFKAYLAADWPLVARETHRAAAAYYLAYALLELEGDCPAAANEFRWAGEAMAQVIGEANEGAAAAVVGRTPEQDARHNIASAEGHLRTAARELSLCLR